MTLLDDPAPSTVRSRSGARQLGFAPATNGLPERRRLYAPGRRITPSVSVVVPTLNEERNLPGVLSHLPACVDELVVVDGNSTDRTIEVALSLVPTARIVRQVRRGKGDALRCGFAASTGDAVVVLDADGSMAPSEIDLFLSALQSGSEFVKGSRFKEGGGSDDITLLRKVGNRALCSVFNTLYGTQFSDLCYGYLAFWRRCLPALDFDEDGFEVDTILNARSIRAGLRVSEVPSYEFSRQFGQSNLRTIRDGFRVLRAIGAERVADRPLGLQKRGESRGLVTRTSTGQGTVSSCLG
jgi:glycosyltransferase involved in cell wall biosynthesis